MNTKSAKLRHGIIQMQFFFFNRLDVLCLIPSDTFTIIPAEAYSIPHGVYMFLGYSEKDEDWLKAHTNQTVLDAVASLDHFMREEVNNQVY